MDNNLLTRILAIIWSITSHGGLALGAFLTFASIVMIAQAFVESRRSGESYTRYKHGMDVERIRHNISLEEVGLRPELKVGYSEEIETIEVGSQFRVCEFDTLKMKFEETHGLVFIERGVEKLAEASCDTK
ncbi:hypothetical protein ONS95_006741 [Cadophora gregata]|uniref:uncharacterized protein n=1 Tax=Cadophora gregata TaxID=51156 RepID=UPI0026DAC84D|nr:uncharacterized protein ONS95_006741 [Cadophora gregata]KAK0101577.1 hypothetical protein ONS95_006741 [Cadophora gregata]KAK0106410.1 hypothetical protein ONS96_004041 [Cadophora gregata f. sp. sojae]